MLDVHTGEVLAYASSPTYDPGALVRGVSRSQWRALRQDPARPLLDRNARGLYPPASTFKVVTAAAAIEAGIDPGFTVNCKGSTMVGRRRFRCWKRGGHGLVDLRRALMGSCDVWFYTVGLELGPDQMADIARRLGLGPPTGWQLNDERSGLVPSRDYMLRRFGQGWTLGDTASAAIGQSITLATPLQLAVMTATVANGGQRPTPWVVARIIRPDGSTAKVGGPLPSADAGLSPDSLAIVRDGMEAVVMGEKGTARRARIAGLPYAGKTGTAQVVSARLKRERPGPETEDHALFVAFAPLDAPQVAVAVVVEHAGSGSTHAAPIARGMLETWARGQGLLPPEEQVEEQEG
jgi:penicillin-binding protein 2